MCFLHTCYGQLIQESSPLTFPAGTGSRDFSVKVDAGWKLLVEVWLALCRLSAAKWGESCFFAVFHNYSPTLESLHIKNIRKFRLWGINRFWKSLKCFVSGFLGVFFLFFFFCQASKSFWQTEISLYGTSPVIASNPRTTKSNWKMLLELCQASA